MRRLLFALTLVLIACGSRTGLPGAAPVDAGEDIGFPIDTGLGPEAEVDVEAPSDATLDVSLDAPPTPCPAPSLLKPLSLRVAVQMGGIVASSGCSFAATWIENRAGRLVVDAATFRYQGGAWVASAVTTVAKEATNLLNSWVAWDGSAYVIGWIDGALQLARMGEDATLLGPIVQSFTSGPDGIILGLDAGADGELRIGFLDDPDEMFHYQGFFARVLPDGTQLLAPVGLTPPSQNPVYMSFLLSADGSKLLWVADGKDGEQTLLFLAHFADDGLVGTSTELVSGDGVQVSSQGLARRVVGTTSTDYFGSWTYPSTDVLLGELASGGAPFTAIHGVVGGIGPALAMLGDGSFLGVLTPDDETGPTDLRLTLVNGTTVASSSRIAANVETTNYSIAGGTGTFGVLWTNESGVSFLAVTP